MLPALLALVTATRAQAVRLDRDERGAVNAEYIGIILVVGAIVSALIGFGPTIASAIASGIQSAISGIG